MLKVLKHVNMSKLQEE